MIFARKISKKELAWSSPKQLHVDSERTYGLVHNFSRAKYQCNRLKGEHNFVLLENKPAIILEEIISYFRYTACGKKKFKFSAIGHRQGVYK